MKKIGLLTIFTCTLALVGCDKKEFNDLSSQEILYNIERDASTISFDGFFKEDLTNESISTRYGISTADIEHGVLMYSSDETKNDKILIVKAKDEKALENIERAFASEIIQLSDALRENNEELKKVEECVFKTKGLYVIMGISEYPDEIELIFDKVLDK